MTCGKLDGWTGSSDHDVVVAPLAIPSPCDVRISQLAPWPQTTYASARRHERRQRRNWT